MQDSRQLMSAPFQMAGTSLFFVAPQLYVLVNHPRLVPVGGIELYIYYALGCFVACIVGDRVAAKSVRSVPDRPIADFVKIGRIAIGTACAGIGGMVALSVYTAIYPVKGAWTGVPVYLYTLSKLVIPALIIVRVLRFSTKDSKYHLWSLILAVPILIQAFQNGRRSWTFLFVFAWFFPAVMAGRLKLRPIYAATGLLVAFLIVTLFPAYRDYAREEGYAAMWEHIQKRPPSVVLERYFSGEQTLEVRDACVLTGIVNNYSLYSYGVRIINRFIKHYVPGGLIGRDLKEALMLPTPAYERYERRMQAQSNFMGGEIKYYTAKTGFFDSFAEFSYLGVLLYFLLGYYFRKIIDLCYFHNDIRAVLFMCFLGFLPAAVVYDEWGNVMTVYLPASVILFLCIKHGTSKRVLSSGGRASVAEGSTDFITAPLLPQTRRASGN